MGGKVESAESRQYVLVSAQISPCTAAAILTVRIIHQQRVHLSFPCSYHPGHVYTLQLRARCIPHNCPHLPASGFSYFIKHIISYIIKKITPIIKKKTSTPIPVPPISVYPASSSSVSGFPIPVRPHCCDMNLFPTFFAVEPSVSLALSQQILEAGDLEHTPFPARCDGASTLSEIWIKRNLDTPSSH